MRNFLCAYIPPSIAAQFARTLEDRMRNARTTIAQTAAFVPPLIRLADWLCMSVVTQGPVLQFEAGLIRKARL